MRILIFTLLISCIGCGPVNFQSGLQGKRSANSSDYVKNKINENLFDKNPIERLSTNHFVQQLENSEDTTLEQFKKDGKLIKGTPIMLVAKYSCVENHLKNTAEKARTWVFKKMSLPTDKGLLLDDDFIASVELANDRSLNSVNSDLQHPCIVHYEIDKEIKSISAFNTSKNNSVDKMLGFDSESKSFFKAMTKGANTRVKVAVIDSGINLESKNFADALTKDLRLTNALDSGDDPTDTNGHGTQMASIIASKNYGLASDHVELIPIRVTSDGTVKQRDLAKAIITAVNLGAEVINLSLSGEVYGCSSTIGYVIHRAINKGAFFSMAAGNGRAVLPEIKNGIPLVAARDDGPLNFQSSFDPACWGRYFLGAVSNAALESQNKLAEFSNFGDDVEMAAPGVGIELETLSGATTRASGTSVSTAITSAAAALAIYHYKKQGFKYSPWHIEDILVQSAVTNTTLAASERRTRFGSVLNFKNLANLLKSTESMTHEEREKKIFTVNPRVGDGWLPGGESNLKQLTISTENSALELQTKAPFNAKVFYKVNKQERDVTKSSNNRWFASFMDNKWLKSGVNSKNFIAINDSGQVEVVASKKQIQDLLIKHYGPETKQVAVPFGVVASYTEEQHQVNRVYEVSVSVDDKSSELNGLSITHQFSKMRYGDPHIDFKLGGVSGLAVWSSSSNTEFKPTTSPGIFSAKDARVGGSYTVFATYKGKKFSKSVQLENETFKSFRIHNHLGNDGEILKGQEITFDSNIVFSSRDQVIDSDWYLNGTKIESRKQQIKVKTANMAYGKHTLEARSKVLLLSGSKPLSTKVDFAIGSDIERLEIHLKDPIAREGSHILVDARAYRKNNSYVVVTDKVKWSLSPASLGSILQSGKLSLNEKTAGKRLEVSASYLNKNTSTEIAILSGNTVTGSNSKLVDLEINVPKMPTSFFCEIPDLDVKAVYSDGTKREITDFSSFSAKVLTGQGAQLEPVFDNFAGGRNLKISIAYSDGSVTAGGGGQVTKSLTIPIPKASLRHTSYSIREKEPLSTYLGIECTRFEGMTGSADLHLSSVSGQIGKIGRFAYSFSTQRIPVGKHPLSLVYSSRASGTLKTITDNIFVEVSAAGPKEIRMTFDKKDFQFDAVASPYGFKYQTNVVLYNTADERMSIDKLEDLPVQAKLNNSTDVATVRKLHPTLGNCDVETKCRPYKTGDVLDLNITHSPTQTENKVKINFIPSAQRTTQSIAKVAPTKTVPSSKPNSSYCTAARKNRLGFADGNGSQANPYRICTGKQLQEGLNNKYNHFADPKNIKDLSFQLEANIDFRGAKIDPIDFGRLVCTNDILGVPKIPCLFEGNGYEIKNYTIVDAEKNSVGLFGGSHGELLTIKNLGVRNPIIKGNTGVSAVCSSCQQIENTYSVGGSVSGYRWVGAIGGNILSKVRNYGTTVYVLKSTAGGLTAQASQIIDSYSSADVIYNGVPDYSFTTYSGAIGGLAGKAKDGYIINSTADGNVFANTHFVGGLVGEIGSVVIHNSQAHGNVVSSGVSVGGLVGRYSASDPSFGVDVPLQALTAGHFTVPHYNTKLPGSNIGIYRRSMIINSVATGNVWGGMSRKRLVCLEGFNEVVGQGGAIVCDGDYESSVGGKSQTGGLVGWGNPFIQDSKATGIVRSVNESGGIIGAGHPARMINVSFTGKVSISDSTGSAGKIIGSMNRNFCFPTPLSVIKPHYSATWTDNQQDVKWDIGSYDFDGSTVYQKFDL